MNHGHVLAIVIVVFLFIILLFQRFRSLYGLMHYKTKKAIESDAENNWRYTVDFHVHDAINLLNYSPRILVHSPNGNDTIL